MDVTTLETLEFHRILEQVASFCLTSEGREALFAEKILTDASALENLKLEVKPFLDLLVRTSEFPDSDFPPLKEIIAKTGPEGVVFDGRELKAVARYVSSAALWKRFLAVREEENLRVWALRFPDFSSLAAALHRVLDQNGEVLEDAVPELVKVKGDIARSRTEIEQTARHFLKDSGHQEFWQTTTPTQKDGRTVLPMKSNFKGRIGAVVHESSASGQTLFIEPYELVEKNNRLVEAQNAWRAEVQRLFRELSAKVREQREGLFTLVENMTRFDLYWARAKWGWSVRGSFPQKTAPGKAWKILQARHPLLGPSAVPIDLDVTEGTYAVLLSGPNTGGKTVSLKTVGLLSVMHQFGLPIPAADETQLPVWDAVLTDIGDHQSLDQALSTFSSHMKRMAEILEQVTNRSLVLLDEMASGTDPVEGGALGMSFLDRFLQTKTTVLGTTHHGALKNFGYTKPGVKNASVEFDALSHKPTYRILPDVPGSSHALDTALRVGIPADLVEKAQKIIEGGETDIASVIRTLKDKQLELRARELETEKKEREFREQKRKTDLLQLRLKQREGELKTAGLGEMNRFLGESRKTFERLVQDIREGQLSGEKIKEVRAFFQETQAALNSQRDEIDNEALDRAMEEASAEATRTESPEPVTTGADIEAGREVFVEPGGQRGTVVRKTGKDRYLVALGAVKMTVESKRLRLARSKIPVKTKVEVYTSEVDVGENPVFSLDLRGFRLEEALNALEKQVDRALLKGLHEFSIVHGLGEGILQKGVQDYLRGRREIQKFFFSHPEEGGFGKTIVQL